MNTINDQIQEIAQEIDAYNWYPLYTGDSFHRQMEHYRMLEFGMKCQTKLGELNTKIGQQLFTLQAITNQLLGGGNLNLPESETDKLLKEIRDNNIQQATALGFNQQTMVSNQTSQINQNVTIINGLATAQTSLITINQTLGTKLTDTVNNLSIIKNAILDQTQLMMNNDNTHHSEITMNQQQQINENNNNIQQLKSVNVDINNNIIEEINLITLTNQKIEQQSQSNINKLESLLNELKLQTIELQSQTTKQTDLNTKLQTVINNTNDQKGLTNTLITQDQLIQTNTQNINNNITNTNTKLDNVITNTTDLKTIDTDIKNVLNNIKTIETNVDLNITNIKDKQQVLQNHLSNIEANTTNMISQQIQIQAILQNTTQDPNAGTINLDLSSTNQIIQNGNNQLYSLMTSRTSDQIQKQTDANTLLSNIQTNLEDPTKPLIQNTNTIKQQQVDQTTILNQLKGVLTQLETLANQQNQNLNDIKTTGIPITNLNTIQVSGGGGTSGSGTVNIDLAPLVTLETSSNEKLTKLIDPNIDTNFTNLRKIQSVIEMLHVDNVHLTANNQNVDGSYNLWTLKQRIEALELILQKLTASGTQINYTNLYDLKDQLTSIYNKVLELNVFNYQNWQDANGQFQQSLVNDSHNLELIKTQTQGIQASNASNNTQLSAIKTNMDILVNTNPVANQTNLNDLKTSLGTLNTSIDKLVSTGNFAGYSNIYGLKTSLEDIKTLLTTLTSTTNDATKTQLINVVDKVNDLALLIQTKLMSTTTQATMVNLVDLKSVLDNIKSYLQNLTGNSSVASSTVLYDLNTNLSTIITRLNNLTENSTVATRTGLWDMNTNLGNILTKLTNLGSTSFGSASSSTNLKDIIQYLDYISINSTQTGRKNIYDLTVQLQSVIDKFTTLIANATVASQTNLFDLKTLKTAGNTTLTSMNTQANTIATNTTSMKNDTSTINTFMGNLVSSTTVANRVNLYDLNQNLVTLNTRMTELLSNTATTNKITNHTILTQLGAVERQILNLGTPNILTPITLWDLNERLLGVIECFQSLLGNFSGISFDGTVNLWELKDLLTSIKSVVIAMTNPNLAAGYTNLTDLKYGIYQIQATMMAIANQNSITFFKRSSLDTTADVIFSPPGQNSNATYTSITLYSHVSNPEYIVTNCNLNKGLVYKFYIEMVSYTGSVARLVTFLGAPNDLRRHVQSMISGTTARSNTVWCTLCTFPSTEYLANQTLYQVGMTWQQKTALYNQSVGYQGSGFINGQNLPMYEITISPSDVVTSKKQFKIENMKLKDGFMYNSTDISSFGPLKFGFAMDNRGGGVASITMRFYQCIVEPNINSSYQLLNKAEDEETIM